MFPMRNFLRLAAIVGTLPNTIANGQTADATPFFADLNFIVTQVNANAAPLANTALLNATNSFTQPQGGVSAQSVSQFVIAGDIITGGYQTLTSTLGTNALTARSTQIIPSSAQAGQAVFLIPSQTNTGAVSLNRDNLGSFAVLSMGSWLRVGELQAGVPARLFLDGSNYHLIGPSSRAPNIYATTAVHTPLVMADAGQNLGFGADGSTAIWQIDRNSTLGFSPLTDNVRPMGDITHRSSGVFTTAIDSFGSALTLTRGQLLFPAVQNPSANANTLDDYSEGAWVPSVGGSATYTTQLGLYVKTGKQVSIQGALVINAIGSGSTTLISGLPFAINSTIDGVAVFTSQTNCATNIVSLTGKIPTGQPTSIQCFSRTAASASEANNAIFQNATTVEFSATYFTA